MAKVALLIGVSEYPPGLNPLPAAERDVDAVGEVLQHAEMGGFDQVEILKNPELLQMQEAINTLFDDRHEDDLLLLYFSGHGITDEYGKFFFSNCNTRKTLQGRLNKATAVPASFVHDVMENCISERQVVILDCCHSGAFAEGMTARDDGVINFEQQLGGRGRIILTSSAATEYSFERQGEELAVYTRYFVEGIKTGAADLDGDGYVSVNELHDYVKRQIRKAAPAMQPERYVFRDGEKILLAKAVISDPERQYRKEVQKYSPEGVIRPAGRKILDRQRRKLNLSSEVAAEIEAEVLQPYREHQQNLQEYEEVFREEVKDEFPLTDRARRELNALQKELKLTDENVAEIEKRVVGDRSSSFTLPRIPSTPPAPSRSPRPLKTFSFDISTVNAIGKRVDRRPGQAEYFREALGNGVFLEMVAIPGGTFLMGAAEGEEGAKDNEYPQRRVTVQPFFMGKFPVTQAQWRQIATLSLNPDPSSFKGDNRPVETIFWHDAIWFCLLLSQKTGTDYFLPSEAEWEYACRAGTTTPFHFGETVTTDLANYDGDGTYGSGKKGQYRGSTTDVGSFPPNAFGLQDMHGNVWEWCADLWHEKYDGAPTDGRVWEENGDEQYRLLRGGSWDYDPRNCRSAYRDYFSPNSRGSDIGFRVVCRAPRTS